MSDYRQQGRMVLTGDGSDYPNKPGHRGVETSAEAAEALMPHLGRLQSLTLDQVVAAGWYGRTANELAAVTGIPREAIQPRTTELKLKGKIVDSGRRRANANGKRAIVWTLPQYRQVAND
jgi:hypothetical protein